MSTAERRRLRRGRPRPLPRGEAADAGQEPEALAFVHLPELTYPGRREENRTVTWERALGAGADHPAWLSVELC